MKTSLSLTILALTLAACGNPHIKSLDQHQPIRSPLAEDCEGQKVSALRYFIDEGPAFKSLTNCEPRTQVTFNRPEVGETPEVRRPGVIVVHRTEIPHGKAHTLSELFSAETFPMKIEEELVLNSLDQRPESRDVLIWSFRKPVSGFHVTFTVKATGMIRLFDCAEDLIDQKSLEMGVHDLGFLSPESNVCHVAISAADGTSTITLNRFSY